MGEIFLAGRRLKEDEFPDPGEQVKGFQIITGELTGQNPGAFQKGKMKVDQDQVSPGELAAPTMDGYFIIPKVFIPNLDFQVLGKTFQLLEEKRFRRVDIHPCSLFNR